ncbi:glutaredoxin-like protein C5orf63 homolog [Magallana gigas]|uniref:glutaredoxin-like protein C5orf63 homolog n=1 Tax=Magallana gigas TaxID=29159 RepID=UPI0033405F9E
MRSLLRVNALLSNLPLRVTQFAAFGSRKLPVLTLYTKEDCSLCDKALEVLKPYNHQFELETVDISLPENKEWYKNYRYDIPVFHLNGQFLMKHRADLKVFHQRLADIENKSG